MTRIIVGTALAICLYASVSQAAEYDRNPDRFPSLGINLLLGGSSGTSDVTASGVTASQDLSRGIFQLGVDARVPVSQSTTLSMGLALVGNGLKTDETSLLVGQEATDGGLLLNLGLRYYFNQ